MTQTKAPIRISTRSSRLALWQARWVAANLGVPAVLHQVTSTGDRVLDIPLQGGSDQGFFTKEIEQAILEGAADLAVHSLKDLPTTLDPRLALVAVPRRETVEDVLLVHPDWVDDSRRLPVKEGGVIGATSLRRRALLGHFQPDLQPTLLRGNVPTRLERLRQGDFAAILLARAGLRRLEATVEGFVAFALDPKRWLPAPGQAALGVESLLGSEAAAVAARSLDHPPTHRAVLLERGLMARFEAGCHAPFAAWATMGHGDEVTLRLGCATDDGRWAAATVTAPAATAENEAMAALEAAKVSPGPAAHESPCVPISSF